MTKVKSRYLKELGDNLFDPFNEEFTNQDKHYKDTGIYYSEIWSFDETILSYLYCHLRYYKDYTMSMLYPSYDKETGKKSKPNMVTYQGKDYYLGSLIDILLDKIRYWFKIDPTNFFKFKVARTKGHEGEPNSRLLLSKGETKHWQTKGLFPESKDGTTVLSNPNTYVMDRTDQVGLYKFRQYTGDIWDIWKVLCPHICD